MKMAMWMAALMVTVGAAWAQPAKTSSSPPPPMARPASSATSSDLVLDLNRASAEEFEKLPGIGPARAKAMVDYQKSHGYRRVEDLTKIQGIGRKTLQKLRPHLLVSARPAAPPAVAAPRTGGAPAR